MTLLRWIEAAVWLGIPAAMAWVALRIRRNLLREATPALASLAERTDGTLLLRYYNLGAAARVEGRFRQREMVLSLGYAHCTLQLETWNPPPKRRLWLIPPEVAPGIEQTGNHLRRHLDPEQLKRDTQADGYLARELTELATTAARLEREKKEAVTTATPPIIGE